MKGISKMPITPVTFKAAQTAQPINTTKKKEESLEEILKKEGIELPKLTPAQKGVSNGLFWAVGGFAFDRLLNKLPGEIFETPLKQSLLINGAIGLTMGVYSFFKAKKLDKKQGTENLPIDKQKSV